MVNRSTGYGVEFTGHITSIWRVCIADQSFRAWNGHRCRNARKSSGIRESLARNNLLPTTEQQPRLIDGLDMILYHVTTGKKAKAYRLSGRIIGPVRGFDTLIGAMAWAIKVGRKVIYRVDAESAHLMPDHHNSYGHAWWTETVTIDRIKCEYSGGVAWPNQDDCDAS